MRICRFLDILQGCSMTDRIIARDARTPKELVNRILSIAPILPGQGELPDRHPHHHPQPNAESKPPADQTSSHRNTTHLTDNLIDFDSRPPSTAPPQTTTKSTQQTKKSASANLMDDDDDISHMNNTMSKMNMHEVMVPDGKKPLERSDTETSEVDVFVDAEG